MPPPLNSNLNSNSVGEGGFFGLFLFFYVPFLFFTYFNFIVSSLLQLCVTHWLWCAWVRSVCSWLYEAEVELSPTDKSNLCFPGFSQIMLSPGELDDGIDITQETRRWKLKLSFLWCLGLRGTRSYLARIWHFVSSQQSQSCQQIYVVLSLRWFFTAFAVCKRSTQDCNGWK